MTTLYIDTSGKYNALCELVHRATDARMCIVMVVGGNQGNGFAVTVPPDEITRIPDLLRRMADLVQATQHRG